MNIYCYALINSSKELISPFYEYLEKYNLSEKDSPKKKELKVKRLMNIKAHLEYIVQNKGNYNIPPLIQKYKNQEIGILKIKEGNDLIRIAFIKNNKDIIILDAIEKPKLYEKSLKRKIDKKISNFLKEMEIYRKDFLKNNRSLKLKI